MRRAISLFLLGGVVAALGVATAHAAAAQRPLAATGTDTETTTTSPTTTSSTSTTTTTTTTSTAPTTTTPAGPTTTTTTTTQPTTQPQPKNHRGASADQRKHSGKTHHPKKKKRRQPMRPPPDFPSSPYPFRADGGLTAKAQHNAVVSIAMQYLGVPYKWGGATPKAGFDCSGLVQYVFAQLGVSLPHYAASQWYSPGAVWIRPERLQPGDLVFFVGSDGTRKEPGHVGIYVGDGYLIDAPHTGSFVRFDSLDDQWFANNYVGATRILGVSLDARRLLHVRNLDASATAVRVSFTPLGPIEPLGEWLGIAATGTAAQTAPRSYSIWAGITLGALFLVLLAGGLVLRRRKRGTPPGADPVSTES
jgi:cell wall-associated NlpC family hydrolase